MNFNDIKIAHDVLRDDEVLRFELINGAKFIVTKDDRLTRSTYTPNTLRVIKKLSTGTQCISINLNHVSVICNTRKSSWLSKDNKPISYVKGDDTHV